MISAPFPQFNAQGQGEFSFDSFPQQVSLPKRPVPPKLTTSQMPEEHPFTSTTHDNFDFTSGFGSFGASTPGLASTPAPLSMAPPSAFPSAVSTHTSEHNRRSPSSRNPSFMSSSTAGNVYYPSAQANTFDGATSTQPSPYSNSWAPVGNAATDPFSSSPPRQTNDQDFDFTGHGYNADGSHGYLFDMLSGALAGQA